ncbi:GntR family transcriptional regulator [Hydrogenophaga crassostreae]|uniref:GntR family transcriptional regulator n=1 Tax=Hydrogenophaga crassostreae TaxID=1763535 RepID=A0A162W2W9_9BURK|nr:GntR family transcriptional regulator [Hydrogenophaga crassostreae]AOW15836.1 GntR family transcriptional regulator [Hydrogenophaga crassostreae]OAD43364.1 GntR family transcriptional regulator [Hydrogenophaga crassostreae]
MISSTQIAQRIIDAVLAQRLAPGARLGEQALSLLFDCSRTQVREALMRLAAKGIVTVSSRRGWYVVQPSHDEAREAFEARRVIEMGLIRQAQPMSKTAITRLRQHLKQEKLALKGSDIGQRSYLLGDFHVCLAECLGNQLLADTLRDFTARTTLIAMLYQSTHDAEQSCEDHVAIVQALGQGDTTLAERLMQAHIGQVQAALRLVAPSDPIAHLREALAPLQERSPSPAVGKPRKRSLSISPTSTEPSTYLGALL